MRAQQDRGTEPEPHPAPGRLRRRARRLGIVVVGVFAAVTIAATAFDLATAGTSRPATALYGGPFVSVGGTLVAYRAWGTSGTPIVLLGGAAEPTWVWRDVGPLLAATHHRVYALDLPPFGYTQRRGPYTMAGWLALIRGFEQRLGIQRPLLVGHSLGAGVAVAAALDDPGGVAGVVLLDGDALAFQGGPGWISDLIGPPYFTALYRLLSGSDWLVGKLVRNAWGSAAPLPGHDVVAEFERPFRVDGTPAALQELVAGGIPGVTLADLRRLSVPRAVVWGAEDVVDTVAAGRASAAALGVGVVLIPGAGHLSMLSRPAAVAAALEQAVPRGG